MKRRPERRWGRVLAVSALCCLISFAVAGENPGGTTRPATASAPAVIDLPKGKLDLGDGMKLQLVRIPEGKFIMGEGKDADETRFPAHQVTLTKPFFMGVYVVTLQQYEKVMGVIEKTERKRLYERPLEVGFLGDSISQVPVRVSWDNAAEFCKRLSQKTGQRVRLPTEAEWEYACRAGTRTKFFFGDDYKKLPAFAWCGENCQEMLAQPSPKFPKGVKSPIIHPVGMKLPNPWGLYDMYGNVSQWCWDWYDAYVQEYGSIYYWKIEPRVDPTGPAKQRVFGRGLSWGRVIRGCDMVLTPASSSWSSSTRSGRDTSDDCRRGFRIVVEAPLKPVLDQPRGQTTTVPSSGYDWTNFESWKAAHRTASQPATSTSPVQDETDAEHMRKMNIKIRPTATMPRVLE